MLDKHYDPVDEREITRRKFYGNNTICQTLRDIYALVDNDEAKLKLRIAMAMAKAMDNKLQEYKSKEKIDAVQTS